jgi:hypothetical protein
VPALLLPTPDSDNPLFIIK